MTKQTYLESHKYVRYLIFGGAGIIAVLGTFYIVSLIAGVDVAVRWVEGGAASQGVNITTEVKP